MSTTVSEPSKYEQGTFKELLFMSLNKMAMPKEEAIQRELAIIQTRLLQCGPKKITGHDREILEQRQEFLMRQQLQR